MITGEKDVRGKCGVSALMSPTQTILQIRISIDSIDSILSCVARGVDTRRSASVFLYHTQLFLVALHCIDSLLSYKAGAFLKYRKK